MANLKIKSGHHEDALPGETELLYLWKKKKKSKA